MLSDAENLQTSCVRHSYFLAYQFFGIRLQRIDLELILVRQIRSDKCNFLHWLDPIHAV